MRRLSTIVRFKYVFKYCIIRCIKVDAQRNNAIEIDLSNLANFKKKSIIFDYY